jgi:hypothetical protein
MIIHSNPGQATGDAAIRGVDKRKGVLLTLGGNSLARKAAGAKKAPGVQSARGDTTRFGFDRPRAAGTKQLSFAAGKDNYVARVARETLREGRSTTRPDGQQLPTWPDVYVVSTEGHEKRVTKGNLRPELQLYLLDKRMHFGDPTVFLGTWLDREDAVFELSVPCRGLLQALMLGRVNRQKAVYHPASKRSLQVPDSRELSRIAAACACAERKAFPDALACVEASLPQPPQDVHVAVLDLITSIMSSPPADVTEELLAQLQGICERASKVDGGYASWLGVAIAHVVHQRKAALSAEPLGQEMLQAAV